MCAACRAPVDPLLGSVVGGKYRIEKLIGEGAMGRVYRAQQIPLGKPFAVKVLSPRLLSDADSQARFAREAHAAANLNHPNCVSVVDYGRSDDGTAYIVMEFIEGHSLEHVIAHEHPLDRARVVDFTLQILDALTEAHGLGILHRDLKPENILVSRLRTHGELLKVVDFGIAQLMDTEESQRLTRQSVVCGTPEYMSPEQARGLPLDPRSDLYAVGCILYQMLTGRPPFERASAIEILHCHLNDAPVPPSELLGVAPDPIEAVCLRALAKSPDDRFADALEFRRALQEAAREAPATRSCPKCHAPTAVSARFCSNCGAEIGDAAPAQARKRPTRRSGLNLARSTSETTADMLRRSYPLPLCGREDLLQLLRSIVDDAAPGLRGLTLTGPEGSGKTRLVDEAAGHAEAVGYRVFYVGRDPSLADTPGWPIRTMVGQVLGIDPKTCTTVDLGRAANLMGVAVEALPGLAELFGLEGPAAALEYRVRKRECDTSALQALTSAGGAKVCLVFDDVDRYDATSRNLLRRLASHATTNAVRVFCVTAESDAGWLGLPVHGVGPISRDAVRSTLLTERTPASVVEAVETATADSPEILPIRLDLRLRLLFDGYVGSIDGDLDALASS
ncbi:MAG: serine/threonine-protein kinase PknK, partial [Deltaproteobacteria bacterium]